MTKKDFTEENWQIDPEFRALCSALVQCKTTQEIANLLRDIGTLHELQAWCERLEVAKQLHQGKTYREVAANTGASTTTVTRVAKYLQHGRGGYEQYFAVKTAHPQTDTVPKKSPSVLQGYLERAQ